MEVKIDNNEVEAKFSHKEGYRFKRACMLLVVVDNDRDYKIKISHESKAFSDFDFHKDKSLIHKNFVFYLETCSGTWYHYESLEKLFQFIGTIYKDNLISEKLLELVKESSEFTDEELAA
jgi:hypothetical protein